eukprot:gene30502-36864_t
MSRWVVLKSSLTKQRDPRSSDSIHRNQNKYVFTPSSVGEKKLIWTGFAKKMALTKSIDVDAVVQEFMQHFSIVDCPEYALHIAVAETNERSSDLVNDILQRLALLSVVVDADPFHHPREFSWRLRLPTYTPFMKTYAMHLHTFHYHADTFTVYSREQPEQRRISMRELQSHLLHEVDNTGNICVWPCEKLLLEVLLRRPDLSSSAHGRGLLEVGGGMTALAALGLAVAATHHRAHDSNSSPSPPPQPSHVVLTDGHPDCVRNIHVCLAMNQQHGLLDCEELPVYAQLLHWADAEAIDRVKTLGNSRGGEDGGFGLVVGSDCLFFTSFHEHLLRLLERLLGAQGRGVFLQPRRAGSLEKWVCLAQAQGWDVQVLEDYLPEVTALRTQYRADADYDDDRCFPVLVVIQRKAS